MSDKNLWDYHQNDNRAHLTQGYPRQNRLLHKVKGVLPVGSKILEIGFGDGYLLNKLSCSGYSVWGQDLSEKNIELTKKQRNNKNIEFLFGGEDGKLLVKDEYLDGFVASEVLEHMGDDELLLCVQEIYRTLKKGGYAFLTFPVKEDLKVNECVCPNCSEVFHRWGHKQYWNKDKIEHTFKNFDIIKINEFFTRYVGNNFLGNVLGYLMALVRTLVDTFVPLEGKTYLVVLKKA